MKIRFEKPPSSPDVSNDLAVRYAQAKRSAPRLRWYLLVAAVTALPGFLAVRFVASLLSVDAPAFIIMQQQAITTPLNARVVSVLPAGTRVHSGETMLTVLPQSQDNSASTADIQAKQEALALTKQTLAIRQQELEQVRRLVELGAATAADLTYAQTQVISARQQVVQAKANLAASMATSTPPPIVIQAPFSGTIISQYAHPGLWVTTGTTLLTLRSDKPLWVRAFLSPKNIRFAQAGNSATLMFANGKRFEATITAVEPETMKVPTNRISPLAQRDDAVVVKLEPVKPLPKEYRIFELPLTVHFGWF